MNEKLSFDFLNQRALAFTKLEQEYDGKIHDRITYILTKICEGFGSTLKKWAFPNADKNQRGSFQFSFDKEFVYINFEFDRREKCGISNKFKIKHGQNNCISLLEKFPYSWLVHDFEEELMAKRDLYKKEVYDSIMEKLSAQDKEILKEFY